jgi:cytosine/adenosine deaminase-related metal-dependent hydrolase
MILRARLIVPVAGPPIPDGAVEVDGGRVVRVGPWREFGTGTRGVTDLGEQVLLPGFVNAHCHLDYTSLRSSIHAGPTFTDWIRRINALKATLEPDDFLRAVRDGFAEAARFGTTTVLNIESVPEVMPALGEPPLRTWWFYELIDVRPRVHDDATLAGALSFFDAPPGGLQGGFGLSPHAPYTASPALYRLAARFARERAMPFTTHVAESFEEMVMFAHGRGALHDFLARIGRPMSDCGHGSPLHHLLTHGCLPPGAILAHLNELADSDDARLAADPLTRTFTVVHCPGSHRYFGHTRFPLERLRALGINLALGTDSLASNRSLSMFREMRLLAESHPALDPADILAMATANGGAALGLRGRLGVIAPGACADLISVPFAGKKAGVFEALLAHNTPVSWTMLDGMPSDASVAA